MLGGAVRRERSCGSASLEQQAVLAPERDAADDRLAFVREQLLQLRQLLACHRRLLLPRLRARAHIRPHRRAGERAARAVGAARARRSSARRRLELRPQEHGKVELRRRKLALRQRELELRLREVELRRVELRRRLELRAADLGQLLELRAADLELRAADLGQLDLEPGERQLALGQLAISGSELELRRRRGDLLLLVAELDGKRFLFGAKLQLVLTRARRAPLGAPLPPAAAAAAAAAAATAAAAWCARAAAATTRAAVATAAERGARVRGLRSAWFGLVSGSGSGLGLGLGAGFRLGVGLGVDSGVGLGLPNVERWSSSSARSTPCSSQCSSCSGTWSAGEPS